MKAYEEGRDACDNGPGMCPYDRGTPDWLAWCDGWDSRSDEKLVEDQYAMDEEDAASRRWYARAKEG